MDEIIVEIDNDIEQIESSNNISVIDNNNIPVNIIEHEYEVTIQKHEYVVTGDDMYIPLSYDDSPQWLKDTINNITNFSLNQKLTELGNLSTSLISLISELEIAKNTYTQSIISSADINSRINSAITTLNSSIAESDATIVDLIATKATPTEASSLALNVLTSSINDGAISSLVSNLQNAISTTNSTLSNNIDIVHSEMTGEFEANATVIDSIQTYVGIDGAGASTGTGLSAYLEGSNGVIGSADSKVANNIYVDGNGISRSKFEYNSSLNIGGVNYFSGFGLSNSSGTGIGSEFWIDASRFKFTNSAKTGSKAPFTIDASGTTPQISFNGVVNFSNITNVPQLGSTPQEVVTAINNAQTTTINGPRITTGSIGAAQIAAYSVSADRFSSTTGLSSVWTGGGLISANFNGNVNGNIGTPTAGFRLSSNAAGTSEDPNIYGAYIKGGTVEGANLIGTALTVSDVKVKAVGYPNNYGPLTLNYSNGTTGSLSAYAYSPVYVSRSYSSGYHTSRMCPLNITFVLSASSFVYGWDTSSRIEISVDGGGWTAITSSATLQTAAFSNFNYSCNTSSSVQFRAVGSSTSGNYPTIVNLSVLAENHG